VNIGAGAPNIMMQPTGLIDKHLARDEEQNAYQ
jgi:hypothetical protein